MVLSVVFIYSCREPIISDDPSLMLEFYNAGVGDDHGLVDTLLFDTILVDFGSTTKYFKMLNPHNDVINISTIQLMGGDNSQFRINVDGVAGNTATDIELEPQDSIYIFAEVTVDPSNINTPFIVEDSVQFITNGNEQYVKLLAYGQNAHFYFRDTLKKNTEWTDDKPYVIMNHLFIGAENELTIKEGVNVYLHNGAYIAANGNLNIYGTKDSLVTFGGTRLEHDYQDTPGQWGTIFLNRNTTNYLEGFHIKNALVGLIIGADFNIETNQFTYENATNCTLKNGIISNSFGPNLRSYLSNVGAENCLLYNSDRNLELLWGGIHQYTHCTIVPGGRSHRDPTVVLSNYLENLENDVLVAYTATLDATFTNSIIYGSSLDQEIAYVPLENYEDELIVNFENCLLKDTMNNAIPTYNDDCIFNENPMFTSPGKEEDFTLMEGSPCINSGKDAGILLDLNGNMRNGSNPDIGCYEFQP